MAEDDDIQWAPSVQFNDFHIALHAPFTVHEDGGNDAQVATRVQLRRGDEAVAFNEGDFVTSTQRPTARYVFMFAKLIAGGTPWAVCFFFKNQRDATVELIPLLHLKRTTRDNQNCIAADSSHMSVSYLRHLELQSKEFLNGGDGKKDVVDGNAAAGGDGASGNNNVGDAVAASGPCDDDGAGSNNEDVDADDSEVEIVEDDPQMKRRSSRATQPVTPFSPPVDSVRPRASKPKPPATVDHTRKCTATTQSKGRCSNNAKFNNGLCGIHEKARTNAAAKRKHSDTDTDTADVAKPPRRLPPKQQPVQRQQAKHGDRRSNLMEGALAWQASGGGNEAVQAKNFLEFLGK